MSKLNPNDMLINGLMDKKPGDLIKMLKAHGFVEGDNHTFVNGNITCHMDPADAVHGVMPIPVARKAAEACVKAKEQAKSVSAAKYDTAPSTNFPAWLNQAFGDHFTTRMEGDVMTVISKSNGGGQRRYTVEAPVADQIVVTTSECGEPLDLKFTFNPHDPKAEGRFRTEFADFDEAVVAMVGEMHPAAVPNAQVREVQMAAAAPSVLQR